MSTKLPLGKNKGPVKKIDSPLAKYSAAGQLYCVLCNTPVKNEIYWTGHINGKSHREQVISLKSKSNKRTNEDSNVPAQTLSKKVKFSDDTDFAVPNPPPPISKVQAPKSVEPLHLNNFASVQQRAEAEQAALEEAMRDDIRPATPEVKQTPAAAALPEGFFDDPKEDAKARGIEYRDPEEVEWEKFVKEIASEEIKSTALRSVDEEESTFSRDLEEIEEQMAHWQKVINLEKKAVEAKQQLGKKSESSSKMEEDDEQDIEYDEDLNWRSKKH